MQNARRWRILWQPCSEGIFFFFFWSLYVCALRALPYMCLALYVPLSLLTHTHTTGAVGWLWVSR